jgi:hypothetical protein
LHQSFVHSTGINIGDCGPESALQLYDPTLGHFIPHTHHINSSSVANVCDTDVFTIELIIKEIGMQIIHQLKKGSNLRLLFKIGKLITRGGKMEWRSMN